MKKCKKCSDSMLYFTLDEDGICFTCNALKSLEG